MAGNRTRLETLEFDRFEAALAQLRVFIADSTPAQREVLNHYLKAELQALIPRLSAFADELSQADIPAGLVNREGSA